MTCNSSSKDFDYTTIGMGWMMDEFGDNLLSIAEKFAEVEGINRKTVLVVFAYCCYLTNYRNSIYNEFSGNSIYRLFTSQFILGHDLVTPVWKRSEQEILEFFLDVRIADTLAGIMTKVSWSDMKKILPCSLHELDRRVRENEHERD